MLRDDTAILARCGAEVLAATSGHGVRWARHRAVQALQAGGTPAPLAKACAEAMVRVSQGTAGHAQAIARALEAAGECTAHAHA